MSEPIYDHEFTRKYTMDVMHWIQSELRKLVEEEEMKRQMFIIQEREQQEEKQNKQNKQNKHDMQKDQENQNPGKYQQNQQQQRLAQEEEYQTQSSLSEEEYHLQQSHRNLSDISIEKDIQEIPDYKTITFSLSNTSNSDPIDDIKSVTVSSWPSDVSLPYKTHLSACLDYPNNFSRLGLMMPRASSSIYSTEYSSSYTGPSIWPIDYETNPLNCSSKDQPSPLTSVSMRPSTS